jgi:hypothetical protein
MSTKQEIIKLVESVREKKPTVKKKRSADERKVAELFSGARALGIDTTLAAVKTLRGKRQDILAYEAQKAEEERLAAEPIKARLQRVKEEQEKKKAEDARLRNERLDATLDEDTRRVERQIQEEADRKLRDEAREKQRKIAERQFEMDRDMINKSAEALTKAGANAAKQAEARRQSRVKTVIGEIDRILSDGDSLCAKLKTVGNDKLTTDAERGLMRESLKSLERRCMFQVNYLERRVVPCTPTQVDSLAKGPR